ncbi:hypothetical protein P4131_17575 [Pseudomonas aeruginosa]|nr:hypothetical protein [Pseudomonas aeruginosa]
MTDQLAGHAAGGKGLERATPRSGRQCHQPRRAQEQLLQLAPELSLDQYAAAMAVGLQAANLAGRTDVQDDLAARGSA